MINPITSVRPWQAELLDAAFESVYGGPVVHVDEGNFVPHDHTRVVFITPPPAMVGADVWDGRDVVEFAVCVANFASVSHMRYVNRGRVEFYTNEAGGDPVFLQNLCNAYCNDKGYPFTLSIRVYALDQDDAGRFHPAIRPIFPPAVV